MRVAAVLALLAAACGLSVTGVDPIGVAPTNDAGASGSSSSGSSSSGGSVEAGVDSGPPVSCADFAGDSTVKRCLDFDDADAGASFGFDELNFDGELKPKVSLEPSPLGANAKEGFALNFFGDSSTDKKRDLAATIAFPDFSGGTYTHVSLDVDVTVDRLDNFAWLAALHFAGGSGCNEYDGLAVDKDRQIVHLQSPGSGSHVLGTYEIGKPFHIHVEANPGGSGPKPFSVSVDNGALDSYQTALPFPDCNYGAAVVGSFFASVFANETFHFRFDQLVLRGTP